jgi:formylglycine-generating enzyme required for sulfatase activity
MVTVQGGTLPDSYGLTEQGVQAFQIGRTEVTWDEWQAIRTWAVSNGYTDLAGVGQGSAANHPVRNVSWYDVVKWSNAKSQMEGLVPVYSVNGTTYKTGSFVPTHNSTANGYRLPGEAEWEWAARGGILSKGYSYSGGNNLAEVGWYRGNSEGALVDLSSTLANSKAGTGTWPVAQKKPNELGLFDMSGNISEWCWDKGNPDNSQIGGYQRHLRGPSWYNDTIEASIIHRIPYGDPTARIAVTGLRLARNIGPKISISGTLPEATLNQAYAGYTFGAVGSTADKVWSISEGALPPGMFFSANGTLSGTPTSAGIYTFVIRLESGSYWDEVEVELEVEVIEANPDYTSGLVAYYPFNGNSNDASGNNRHGTVSGAELSADRFGLTNRAFYFDGVNFDKISINIPSLSEMTLSLWVTPSGAQTGNGIGRFLHSEPEWFDVGLSNPAGSYIGTKIGSQDGWRQSSVKLEPSIAQMVTFTAGYGSLKIYLNGKLVENVSYNGTLGMSPKVLGSYVANQGDDFYGVLDDVRIYNRVLTEEQISSLHVYEKSDMVSVKGGALPSASGFSGQPVAPFQIGKYEVTWDEWQAVRTWAVANGYTDLANIGAGSAGNHPVRHVNWYDVVKWCNAKSQKEGLTPVYQVSGAIYKTGQSEPTVNTAANGYRLPLEKEWEWAALGGVNSKGFNYSGSNDINSVSWHASNSGSDTKAVGLKTANELMIFDMSGNVAEWCWGTVKPRTSPRGGGCLDTPIGNSIPGSLNPEVRALQFGFRFARNLDTESTYDIDGIRYIFVKDKVRSWSEAKLDAESRGGQLATFSTSTKWSKLAEKLTQDYDKNGVSAWIGAIRTASGWKWVDDSPFSFTNWSPREPNNSNDKVIMIWGKSNTHDPNDTWSSQRVPNAWNDAPDSTAYRAASYILEIK